jgi:ABC-type spermidine/putrescine transport system permease subunit I
MLGQTIYDLVLHTLNWPFASAIACVLVALQLSIVFVYMKGSRRGIARAR